MYIFLYLACFFFFNDTATTEIYTLSLHDALPIYGAVGLLLAHAGARRGEDGAAVLVPGHQDRKSTRLNSSHANISYAVFCLKKKKKKTKKIKKIMKHQCVNRMVACKSIQEIIDKA